MIWLAALLAYSNSFRSGLIFDNFWLIVKDPRVHAATSRNIELILTREYWYDSALTGLYRPLSTLSYLFNYAILGNGDQPAGYHWLNLGLHAFNIALVYLLGLILLEKAAPAMALAALWALHPVATESVTNVIGRADILSAFGVLGGLLCHIRSAGAAGRGKLGWLTGLMLFAAVGLFSKESAVVVLAAMALYDATFRPAAWRHCIAGYAALAPPLLAYFAMRAPVLAGLPPVHPLFVENPLLGAEFLTARLTAVKVIGKYLWLLVWPAHLSNDYSYNQVPLVEWSFRTWEDWKAVIALCICLAAAAGAIACYRRCKPVFFFIVFFFAALAPASNVFLRIGTIMAERFLYLPSIGFAGCVVAGVYSVARRLPAAWPAAPAVLAAIALASGARTFARNRDWLDARSLWTSAVLSAPNSFRTHMLLGATSTHPKGLDLALSETERGLAILDPLPDRLNDASSYSKAGFLYCRIGDSGKPRSADWYRKSVNAFIRAGRIGHVAGKISAEPYFGMAIAYFRLGDSARAVEALNATSIEWPRPEFFEGLSGAYSAAGDLRQAAVTLIEGLVLDPGAARLAAVALELYKLIDPGGCSVRGASLDLQCPLVHDDLCAASRNVARELQRRNQESAAEQTRRSAVTDMGCLATP
ncbi:MAG TPA: DUF1736 domain-containing protein [Bryobacteraceae bacterium]|nr:DUF1736 domain-containing protein [Bryobacteraceae bacterium]